MADTDYRVERDSMGETRVPARALWGAQTQRAIQNFPISGIPMPRGFIRALGLVKWAAAGANLDLGDLGRVRAFAIQRTPTRSLRDSPPSTPVARPCPCMPTITSTSARAATT